MFVLGVSSGFAKVVPRCLELVPRDEESFFVDLSALDIGPAMPFESNTNRDCAE